MSGDEGREDAERDPILQGQHHWEHRAGTSAAIWSIVQKRTAAAAGALTGSEGDTGLGQNGDGGGSEKRPASDSLLKVQLWIQWEGKGESKVTLKFGAWDIKKILNSIYWEGKTARGQISPKTTTTTKTSSVWWEITLGILSLFMVFQLWDWLRCLGSENTCKWKIEGRANGAGEEPLLREGQEGGQEDRSALYVLATKTTVNGGTDEMRLHTHYQKRRKKKMTSTGPEAEVEKPEHLLMLVGM